MAVQVVVVVVMVVLLEVQEFQDKEIKAVTLFLWLIMFPLAVVAQEALVVIALIALLAVAVALVLLTPLMEHQAFIQQVGLAAEVGIAWVGTAELFLAAGAALAQVVMEVLIKEAAVQVAHQVVKQGV